MWTPPSHQVIVTPSRAYAPAAVPASLQSFCTVRPLSTGHHELQGFVEFHPEPMGKGAGSCTSRSSRPGPFDRVRGHRPVGPRLSVTETVPTELATHPRSDTLTAGGPKLGSHGQATLVRDVVAKANERPRLAGRQRPPPTHLGRSASPAGSATASTGFQAVRARTAFFSSDRGK